MSSVFLIQTKVHVGLWFGIEAPAGDAFRGSNLEPLPSLVLSPGSQDHSDSPGVAPASASILRTNCKALESSLQLLIELAKLSLLI